MTKRTMDVALSALALLIALPVMLVLAAGVMLTLHTNPFFVQPRVGRNGRIFRMIKLRTLPRSTPVDASKFMLSSYRIPKFCSMLRALHLDELPQLALVLVGKMSLVGPRPEMPILHSLFSPAFARERQSVRPGCTGLWQISEASQGLISDRPEFDQFYVEHHTNRLDLWVLGRTLRGMTSRRAPLLSSTAAVPAWLTEPERRVMAPAMSPVD